MTRRSLFVALVVAMSCTQNNTLPPTTSGSRIVVQINGALGTAAAPLPINFNPSAAYTLHLEMHDASDQIDTSFNSFVRISAKPGTVYSVNGGADGRNVKLVNGVADNVSVTIVAAFGQTRIWAQDIGYVPVDPTSSVTPQCANNIDDNGNGLVDYPADPGCFAPNDDDEGAGTGATGVSDVIYYARPRIADVRGAYTDNGTGTPFPNEQVDIDTGYDLQSNTFAWDTIVTGLSSSGFFVTDLQDQTNDPEKGLGYGSVFAYTFSAPTKIGVCDRLRLLQGTSSDFFGYTELNFPTWAVEYWDPNARPCLVPEATVLSPTDVGNPGILFKQEAGLVRVQADTTQNVTLHVGSHFGSKKPDASNGFVPTSDATNCDLNGNGKVDYSDANENACATACTSDIECSEYSSYASNGGFTIVVSNGTTTAKAQGNATAATSFDPVAYVEQANATSSVATLNSFTGNLTYFSGGSQFTMQARCDDDVRFKPNDLPLDSSHACVNQNGNNPDQQN